MSDRIADTIVFLPTALLISKGVATATALSDGRRISVLRQGAEWAYRFDGTTYAGFSTDSDAIYALSEHLANEGILLRVGV